MRTVSGGRKAQATVFVERRDTRSFHIRRRAHRLADPKVIVTASRSPGDRMDSVTAYCSLWKGTDASICGAVAHYMIVGWFTAIYPVWLETRPPSEQQAHSVQETLRQIRLGHGCFGLLRYLVGKRKSSTTAKHPLPEISFR